MTKQAYYKRDGEKLYERQLIEEFALQYIRQVRALDPGIGCNKLWAMYRREMKDASLGRDRFHDLLRRHDLMLRKVHRKPRTTDSRHGLPTFPNLVKELIPERPNQVWVSDITYLTVWHGNGPDDYHFVYLTLITDAYDKRIVAWRVGDTLEARHSITALREALQAIDSDPHGLIFHSDRGVQYASREFVTLVQGSGARVSMTESGDPRDNAIAERVNSTVKNELLKDRRFRNAKQVRKAVAAAVLFYNTRRPHLSLGGLTPEEAHRCTGPMKKQWRSYREAYLLGEKNPHNPKNVYFCIAKKHRRQPVSRW